MEPNLNPIGEIVSHRLLLCDGFCFQLQEICIVLSDEFPKLEA